MKPFLRPNRIASLCFGLAAAAPVGTWVIFLFGELPNSREHLDKAARALSYAFTASGTLWFFVLLTGLAVLLVGLALVHWQRARADTRGRRLLAGLGIGATLLALAIQWPAAIAAGMGTYYGCKRAEV